MQVSELTDRETEVLELITRGRRNTQIATELGISLVTVKCHVWRIYKKLGVKNRVQACVKAVQLGMA